MSRDRLELGRLERATGVRFGIDPRAPRFPKVPPGTTPRAALEAAILPALERSPCCVFFSGGRDSSAVLASAVHTARRHGLSLPVPVTLRFEAGGPAADEREWQELVVGHLGLSDWVVIEVGDTLDTIGAIGRDVLRRHRLIFPTTPHTLVPALRTATGGSLLTGTGGDEAFLRRSRINEVLARRARPKPRDVVRLAVAVGPRPVRRAAAARRFSVSWPWLRPPTLAALRTAWADDDAGDSVVSGRRLEATWRSRSFQGALAAFRVLADDHDVLLAHPLADPRFLAAVARRAGFNGFSDRTAAMRAIFTGLVPDEVNSRTTKARFDMAFWTGAGRAFAEAWDGRGVDEELVDVDVLRQLWTSETPPPAPTLVLLKQAWLAASDAGLVDDALDQVEGGLHRFPAAPAS